MMNIDQDKMHEVSQEAFDKAEGQSRWQRAIAKAIGQLESNPYMHFDGNALLILSDSNNIYSANGSCQCKAYRQGHPCWHRAAARLVERYNETSH
jgi:outer membrane protein assembly factor BamB